MERAGQPADGGEMSPPPGPSAPLGCADAEHLLELRDAAPPASLVAGPVEHSFHRDIYFDTTEGALARRDVTCRVRIGADDGGASP